MATKYAISMETKYCGNRFEGFYAYGCYGDEGYKLATHPNDPFWIYESKEKAEKEALEMKTSKAWRGWKIKAVEVNAEVWNEEDND